MEDGTKVLIAVAAVGVGAGVLYLVTRPSAVPTQPGAASQVPPGNLPSGNPPPQQISLKVGDTLIPPALPALPDGWGWNVEPGWNAGPPGSAPIVDNGSGGYTAVQAGTITLPFVAQQHGPGPAYTGINSVSFIVTVI